MSCFHPKLAFLHWDSVEQKYHVRFVKKGETFVSSDSGFDLDSFTRMSHPNLSSGPIDRFVQIPCGKCIGCLNDKASDWSKRIQLEASRFPGKVWFVTLTYSDPFLPWASAGELKEGLPVCDPSTGEILKETFLPSLCKSDLVTFLKNLRNRFGDGIRFFGCGEYSPKGRPHYHLIIFNLDLSGTDKFGRRLLEPYGEEGSNYFTSQILSDCWKPQQDDFFNRSFETMGQLLVVPYEPATGRYVAKYLIKARDFCQVDFFDMRQKPFLHMSRRPGIGRFYFDEKKARLSKVGSISLSSPKGAYTTSLPRYFQRLLRDDPQLAGDLILRNKRRSDVRSFSLLPDSDLSFSDRLRNGEENAGFLYRRRKEL